MTKIKQTDDIFIEHTYKRFLTPTILALLGTTFSSFGNTLLAGRFLGKEVLGAMNILSSFTFLYAMLGCLISIGAAAIASISVGREDRESAGRYEWLSFVLSIAVPAAISLLCLINFKGVFTLLGGDEEAYRIGATYGRLVIAFGFLNTLMYFPFNFLRLIGKGRYGMLSYGLMGLIDVLLVYVFLKLGMGAPGVALGYIISMLAADISGIYFLFKKNTLFKMLKPPKSEMPEMCRKIALFGGAAGLNNLCKMIRTMTMNLLISRYLGRHGLQSFAVACSVINLASASVTGFAQAVSPIIGVLFGERDRKGQLQTVRISILYSIIFHTLLAFLLYIFAAPLAAAFGITGVGHIADTALLIRLIGISFIPASVMNIFIYYYTAIGQNRISMILTLMHALVLVVVFSGIHLFVSSSNLYGIAFITAELADFLVMFLLSLIRRRQHPELEGLLLCHKTYAQKFFSTVSDGSEEGAVATSGQVVSFCEENGVSPGLCVKLPLVIEELLVVLAGHCFDKPGSHIDVRISLVNEEVLIRMRCEGAMFNPVEWYIQRKHRLSPEDFMMDECFGMNVVDRLVYDVKYTNTFGVNNLIVTMGSGKAGSDNKEKAKG